MLVWSTGWVLWAGRMNTRYERSARRALFCHSYRPIGQWTPRASGMPSWPSRRRWPTCSNSGRNGHILTMSDQQLPATHDCSRNSWGILCYPMTCAKCALNIVRQRSNTRKQLALIARSLWAVCWRSTGMTEQRRFTRRLNQR